MLTLLTRTGGALALGVFILIGAIRAAIAGEWLDASLAGVLGLASFWFGCQMAARVWAKVRSWRHVPAAE